MIPHAKLMMTDFSIRCCQFTFPLISWKAWVACSSTYHSMTSPFSLYNPLKMSHLRHDTLILLCLSKSGARLGKFYMNPMCLNSQLSLPIEFLKHVVVLGLMDFFRGLSRPCFDRIERRETHVTTTHAI